MPKPDSASHGATVRAAAKSDDPTPETNHGADVSGVARDNHGHAQAAEHQRAGRGKPDWAGKPDHAGKHEGAGKP